MRFAGITIPENKRIEIGLTSVFGIGRNLAHKILDEAKIEYGFKPKEISANNEAKISPKHYIKQLFLNVDNLWISSSNFLHFFL